MRDYVVGDMVLEIMGIWVLVLVGTGLYLWWPRKLAMEQGLARVSGGLLGIRRGATGRARWRDLHGLGGSRAARGDDAHARVRHGVVVVLE